MEEEQKERRKNGGLSDEQIAAIKQAILDSIYQEIGKSLVKKLLWAVGVIVLAALAWLHGAGSIKIPGATE